MSQAKLNTLETLTLTSGGTAEALSSSQVLCQAVYITAPSGNSGAVFIGDSNVASDRYLHTISSSGGTIVLEPVEGPGGGALDYDLSEIYWDGTTNDTIQVGYITRSN